MSSVREACQSCGGIRDAWRCAVARSLTTVSCPCQCHRYLAAAQAQGAQVQACRAEDRAMLQTEAGRELLQAATLAIAQEPPAPPDDAVANLAQYLRDLAALMPPLGQEDDKRAQLLRAAAALEAQGGATDKAYRKGRLDMWSELAAIDPALAETATELTSGYNLRRDENDGLQGQLREAQANLRAARARCDKLGPELDEMMRQRDLYTVERNAAHDLAAQLSLDAERYRWLREETSDLSFMFTLDKHGKPLGIKAREMLDEAIDTLRAALPKDPHA